MSDFNFGNGCSSSYKYQGDFSTRGACTFCHVWSCFANQVESIVWYSHIHITSTFWMRCPMRWPRTTDTLARSFSIVYIRMNVVVWCRVSGHSIFLQRRASRCLGIFDIGRFDRLHNKRKEASCSIEKKQTSDRRRSSYKNALISAVQKIEWHFQRIIANLTDLY